MKDSFIVNTSAIITNKQGKILIIQRSLKEDVYPGYWGIPGGTLDKIDTNLEASLRREILEEVGIEVSDIKLVQNNTVIKDDCNKLYLVFTAQYKSGKPQTSNEVADVQWKDVKELAILKMTPYTYNLIKEICL